MATCERFGPGESLANPMPGDFILTHERRDFFARLIQVGQGLRFRGSDARYARWNHAALIVSNGRGMIVEALSSGVRQRYLSEYAGVEYVVVHVRASQVDCDEAVAFAMSCLNDGYGWWTIVSIALSVLTGCKFSFGYDGQEICSGLVARSLERTSFIPKRDASHLMPADLAKAFEVQ